MYIDWPYSFTLQLIIAEKEIVTMDMCNNKKNLLTIQIKYLQIRISIFKHNESLKNGQFKNTAYLKILIL